MAGSNLVQIGATTILASNNFGTETYGCDNFENVLLHIKNQATGTTSAGDEGKILITIQAGTETIVNRVPLSVFASLNQFLAGTGVVTAWAESGGAGEALLEIDTGCHYLDKGAELTVSIMNTSGSSLQYSIYSKVNGISVPSPQKWLWRTDNAFMLPLVESLFAFELDDGDFFDQTGNCTLQYGTENVLVPFQAGAVQVNADSVGDSKISNMSILYDSIPRSMQINTTTADIGFLAQCKEIATPEVVTRARKWIPNKFKGLSKRERIVLAQGH